MSEAEDAPKDDNERMTERNNAFNELTLHKVVNSHLRSGRLLINRNAKRLPSLDVANHNELNRSSNYGYFKI